MEDEIKANEKPAKRKKRLKPTDRDYLSNEVFTNLVVEWIADNKDGVHVPMKDELVNSFNKLINNYAKHRWFSGYSYLDDMKSAAFVRCLKYGHNFNIEKSTNAFSYFTQVIHNSFRKMVEEERTQQKIKYNAISESNKNNFNDIKLESSEDYTGVYE